MIGKLIEWITGQDDLERVADRGDLGVLNNYLKTRRLFVPIRPSQFLDPDSFTPEDLLKLLEEEGERLSGDIPGDEIWVLEEDGRRRLPVFSSQKKMEIFTKKLSPAINKVFSLGCVEILMKDLVRIVDVDYLDLNPMSKKSWEIGVGSFREDSE